MRSGGFQKSLISLLHYLDYDKYNVDLLLLSPGGNFMKAIPRQVNILQARVPSVYFEKFPGCVKELLSQGNLFLAIHRITQAIIAKVNKGYGGIVMSKVIPVVEAEYDVIIDYNGQYILYYMIDKLRAKKKITYFHSDYKKWPYYYTADKKYFKKVDYIVTVSDQCKQSLDEVFPDCSERIKVIENIVTQETVTVRQDHSPCCRDDDFTGISIVMVGRVCCDKGIDLAIEACRLLKHNGYNIRWYSVGPCNNYAYFNKLVKQHGVDDCFVFIGETSNPYIYMRQADIIAHPSRFEGKAVAVEEAKILAKPIVVTNFSTAHEQIQSGRNGMIVALNAEALYQGIKQLIDEPALRQKLTAVLNKEAGGNASEIEKLYQLIEG